MAAPGVPESMKVEHPAGFPAVIGRASANMCQAPEPEGPPVGTLRSQSFEEVRIAL